MPGAQSRWALSVVYKTWKFSGLSMRRRLQSITLPEPTMARDYGLVGPVGFQTQMAITQFAEKETAK
jgi:hypothetical protein